MPNCRIFLAAGALCVLSACIHTPLNIAPPRVHQGGRALSIGKVSDNDQRLIVATETGGLFQTYGGGKSWIHVDSLPNFATVDVVVASTAPDTMIATTQPQYHAVNDGGIWRSTSGGAGWTQAAGWESYNCGGRPGGFGISNMPLSHTFYVATDCGLAVSNDDGASWSPVQGFYNRMRSVLVVNSTFGVAVGDYGMWYLNDSGAWTPSQPLNSGGVPVPHAFAAPWFGSSSIIFHASGDQKLWVSSDKGATWTEVPAPSIQNREAFVRVGRSLTGDDSKFEVYYGDGAHLNRQTFSFAGPTGTGTWTKLTLDHNDASDIAFDAEFRIPILLATDGGVHVTPDQGDSWTLTGGGYGGFDALQIAEIKGAVGTGSPPQQFLYYATQDNDLKASSDGGGSWTGSICCEGGFISATPSKVTGSSCSPCSTFVSGAGYQNQGSWPSAPNGASNPSAVAPFLVSGDSYVQLVTNTQTTPPSYDFFTTSNAGASWSPSFSLSSPPVGASVIVGPANAPTLYEGVALPGSLPNGGSIFGLVRATNLFGSASVASADGSQSIAIGRLHTPSEGYIVLGADPNNPNHLLTADVLNSEMKYSDDGGSSWYPLHQLTQAVTSNGQFLFSNQQFPLASVIAWDPVDSCRILVGTVQNGIFQSTDGGNTWAQISGSPAATYVSSFYFPPKGQVWVSTNGRGLWTLDLGRNGKPLGRCVFPHPGIILPPPGQEIFSLDPSGSRQPFKGPGDPSVCDGCILIVVRNGWVTGLANYGSQVTSISISGGTIYQLDSSGKPMPLSINNSYLVGDGKLSGRLPPNAVQGSLRVRGLILRGNQLERYITSEGELPFAPQQTPRLFLYSASQMGQLSVGSGDQLRVVGTNFVPGAAAGEVTISLDGKPAGKGVTVSADGTFSVDLPVQHAPGQLVVTAEQQDGHRLIQARASIDVRTSDVETKGDDSR